MSFVGKWIGKLTGAQDQADAIKDGASTQAAAAQLGIDEQRRQFDAFQKMNQPFVDAGTGGLSGQQDLLGLHGAGAQQSAIGAIQSSPQFAALQQQGNNAILQNASATGGLRGGNTQGALAQFSPQLLSSLIDQQYQRLGGMTQIGQASAAGTGAAGMQTGANVAQLLQQQGAATAGGQIAGGSVGRTAFNDVLGIASLFAGKSSGTGSSGSGKGGLF